MSEKIYASLSEDFVRRMRNWARYDAGFGAAAGMISIYGLADFDRYPDRQIVVLCGEAEDTKAAIDALPGRYRDTVKQFWRHEGMSLRWHGRRRDVEHRTFEAWVMLGHELLQAELARRSELWRRRHADRAALQFGT